MAARSLARALMDEILEEGGQTDGRTGKDINGGDAENIRRVKWSFGQKERERDHCHCREWQRERRQERGRKLLREQHPRPSRGKGHLAQTNPNFGHSNQLD